MSQALVKESKQHSLVTTMASRYELEPNKFLSVIEKTIFPANSKPSLEQIAAFLVVANQYELNPFIKEIYAFPARGGGIVPIVSVDGWLTIINRQSQLDGVEFQDHIDDQGQLTAVTARVYRKDRSHATEVTEYMNECKRDTDTWRKWPARMLRHKALIQGARYAFGLAGIYDPDEAERIAEDEPAVSVARKTKERVVDLRQRLVGTQSPIEGEIVGDAPTEPQEDAAPKGKKGEHVVDPQTPEQAERDALKDFIMQGCQHLNAANDDINWTPKTLTNFINERFQVTGGLGSLSVEQMREMKVEMSKRLDRLEVLAEKKPVF